MSRRNLVVRAFDFARWKAIGTLERVHNLRTFDGRSPHMVWEVHTLRKLFATLPVDCVFDVGANRGEYAAMLRNQVGYKGLIISFEPIPELAARLRKRAVGDRRWQVEQVALAEADGTATFNIMNNPEFSSLHPPLAAEADRFGDHNRVARTVSVRTESLATALQRLRTAHGFEHPFLKLDTQGHDAPIVRAALPVIREFVAIQSELSFVKIYEDSVGAEETLELYRDAGFELGAFIPNNAGHFPRLIESDCLMVRDDLAR